MHPVSIAAGKDHLEFSLQENHPLRLRHAAGRRIECLSGLIWITAYNKAEDFMIRPGESFLVPNGGLTLMEAVGSARARIERPRRKILPKALAFALEWSDGQRVFS
jgi:Protein of unknown function (DUF2917)